MFSTIKLHNCLKSVLQNTRKTVMNKAAKLPNMVSPKSPSSDNPRKSGVSTNVTNSFQVLASPTKSASDQKEYRVIKLANGLTACLISDKTSLNACFEEEESGSEAEYSDESEEEG